MARMPSGQPRSVPDPGAAAYDESTRREAELTRRREAEEARMRKLKEAADITEHELTAAEVIPKAIGHIGRDAAASSAAKSIGRYAGPAGVAVLGAEFGGPSGAVLGAILGGLGGSKAIENLQLVYRELKAHLFIPRSDYGPRFQPSNMIPMPRTPSSDPRFWMSVSR